MNVYKMIGAILLALWLVPAGLVAQDDLDLESLLDDLDDLGTEEVAEKPQEATADPVAPEQDDLSLDGTDDGLDDLSGLLGDAEASEPSTAEDNLENLLTDTEEPITTTEDPTPAMDELGDLDNLLDTPLDAEDDILGGMSTDDDLAALLDNTPDDLDIMDEPAAEVEDDDLAALLGDEEPSPVDVVTASEDDLLLDDVDMLAGLEDSMEDLGTEEEPSDLETVEDILAGVDLGDDTPIEEIDESTPGGFSKKEEVRRQAAEVASFKKIDQAFVALDQGSYEEAISLFDEGLKNLPIRPATEEERARASWGHAEAYYKRAAQLYRAKQPDLEKANEHIKSSIKLVPNNQASQTLQAKISRALERAEKRGKLPVRAGKNPIVVKRKQNINALLREGRDYYSIADYNTATALFNKVLRIDEYNTTAMSYLRRIAEKRMAVGKEAYRATKAQALAKVKETWTPPIVEQVKPPETIEKGGAVEKQTEAEKLRTKMTEIIIPKIEFRDANIQDVIDFLAEVSRAVDPTGEGVNIVLNLPQESGVAANDSGATSSTQDDFDVFGADFGFEEETTSSAPDSGIGLTLNLRGISLLDAVKTITEITGLRYRIDDSIVIIYPRGVVQGQVVTRMYPVQPTILQVVVQRDDSALSKDDDFREMGGAVTTTRDDVKDFFQSAGVPFPAGTSITYNSGISQLIVANTPENLELFERILAQLNVIPNQVEIEARFIEIAETDLKEVGLEWILNDNWELAHKKGTGPISSQERIQANANANGFSQGLRFFGYNAGNGNVAPSSAITSAGTSALGSILSISSILTNPELSVVLHALDQSGGTDLLSAPRVTARSGYSATIEVVREIIYPTEFDAQSQSVGTGAADSTDRTQVVVTPGSFETREVGVILNVTPTVGPDGYTIDLAMVPEVSELVAWIEYGVTGTDGSLSYSMRQPVFTSRNVTTSIVIWDGQTVVMGGLIREELVSVHDKVPLLGDIPFLGRLFRTDGEKSEKRNLLIFVTARLVDPAGKPIHKQENVENLPGSDLVSKASI